MTERPTNKVSRGLRSIARDAKSKTSHMPRLSHATQRIENFAQVHDVQNLETVSIAIESRSSPFDALGAALIELRAKDRQGIRQSIPGWAFVSARVGEYHYLNAQAMDDTALTIFDIKIPTNVSTLELIGHCWKRAVKTEIIGSPLFSGRQDGPLKTTATGRVVTHLAHRYREVFPVPQGATHVDFRLPISGGSDVARVPFRYEFIRSNGELALPASNMAQHKTYGAIELVETHANDNSIAQMRIPLPRKIEKIAIAGVDWGDNTPTVLENATVNFEFGNAYSASEFLNGLEPNQKLVLIDTTAPPVGHKTLSLRPNNLAKSWAKLGIAVIFLPFSTIQDQDALPCDNILQVNRGEFEAVKTWLFENRAGSNNTYVCSSFPSNQAITLVDAFNARGWNTVYECRDDMEEFNRVGYSKWYHPQLERRVVEQVDQVTAVSNSLANKLKSITKMPLGVEVTPNGVNRELIEEGACLRTKSTAVKRSESMKFGYVGHLTDAWFDWDLVISAAAQRPSYQFEIVGHGKPDHLSLPPNVKCLGPMAHEHLPQLVGEWRAGLIPFINSPLTRSVDPNKIYEYYAWGLPCISAEMGSVREYPLARVYESAEEFIAAMDDCLSRTLTDSDLELIEEFLSTCSWDYRAAQTSELFFR